jgi:hypothetical protein
MKRDPARNEGLAERCGESGVAVFREVTFPMTDLEIVTILLRFTKLSKSVNQSL